MKQTSNYKEPNGRILMRKLRWTQKNRARVMQKKFFLPLYIYFLHFQVNNF